MFGVQPNNANAYAAVGMQTQISTADPHKLIAMLFEGAQVAIGIAAVAMDAKDPAAKGQAISKAVEIIVNGLKVSLDRDAGGVLADRLAALYDYMADRLVHANLHNSRPALDEVARLLQELAEAWSQINTRNTVAA